MSGVKLELTEPRIHAMAKELKVFGGWTIETCHKAVAALIAAANSIPEGAPVGTGALRPDGAFVAIRVSGPYWTYVNVNQDDDAAWPHPDAADSWPVIYDPSDQVAVNPDAGLEFFPPGEEPLVPRPDPAAQQEPGVSDPRSTSSYGLSRNEPVAPKPPRTPRVRDRLGVDEQGARWRSRSGSEYHHDGIWWRTNLGQRWQTGYEPWADAPYAEILEPRVLPSLDCLEARDGTVWEWQGWRFWFNGAKWRTDLGVTGNDYRLHEGRLLRNPEGYTEVIGEPVVPE